MFLSSSPRQKEITNFPPLAFFENLFSPGKREKDYGAEKKTKIKLRGYWSQVLINSTISATFTFLVSVLLYHNLDSSMMKHKAFLT